MYVNISMLHVGCVYVLLLFSTADGMEGSRIYDNARFRKKSPT